MKQNLTHITTSNQVEDAHESKTFTTLSDELAHDNAPQQRSPAIRQHGEGDIVLCQVQTTKSQTKQ